MIDGHENTKKEIETKIEQGSPVLPVLFLIYMGRMFDSVLKTCPQAISFSFIDDLGFITSGLSVPEITKSLEKVAKTVL